MQHSHKKTLRVFLFEFGFAETALCRQVAFGERLHRASLEQCMMNILNIDNCVIWYTLEYVHLYHVFIMYLSCIYHVFIMYLSCIYHVFIMYLSCIYHALLMYYTMHEEIT
jgi:hypothetical protein